MSIEHISTIQTASVITQTTHPFRVLKAMIQTESVITQSVDATERPMTLIEKIQPILDDLMMECFKHGFHQSEMTEAEFIDYSRKNCVPLRREIIGILKQHEAESEVQDD